MIIFNTAEIIEVLATCFVFFLAIYKELSIPTITLKKDEYIKIGTKLYP